LVLFNYGSSAPDLADDGPSPEQRADSARRHGLDPTSSLESRIRDTPATVLKMFKESGATALTPRALTEAERRKLSAAFTALPPLHQRVLSERLRSVSFLDGMPNTALTSTVNPAEPYRLFDITIRAAILRENVSEWLTEKEQTCFDAAGSPLSVSIDAGKLDAVVCVLLHEATHVVDSCLRITPEVRSDGKTARNARVSTFTEGVWSESTIPSPRYREPLLERVRFRTGQTLPVGQAEAIYTSLRNTPFVSLYGSRNWYDDLAEYVSVYHLTKVLKQPYRIVIWKEGKEVFAYEPMKSKIVRSRLGQMKRFYEEGR
jgi:hypothetical protein